MTINITRENDTYTVALEGSLDPISSPQLQDELDPILPTAKKIIFELSGLEYISSSGIRVVLATYRDLKNHGGELLLLHPTESVSRVFHITKLDGFLTIKA